MTARGLIRTELSVNHFVICVPSFRAIFKFKECFHEANMEKGVSRIIVWAEKTV